MKGNLKTRKGKDGTCRKKKYIVPSTALVERHFENSHEKADESESNILTVHTFEVEPAQVTMQVGLTLNLGNYESATIKRGLTIPCYREEIPVVERRMSEWLMTRIRNDRKRIKGSHDLIDEPDLGLTGCGQEDFIEDANNDESLFPEEF